MFMKNQLLVLSLAAGVFSLSGCRNDAIEEAVSFSLGEPTRTEFTFQAGLGSAALQASGSLSVTVESSAPDWCRAAVYDNSTVVYNVDTNRSMESRSATITVSAEGFPSESFNITQGPLIGLIVTPTDLVFSDEVTDIEVEVIAACDYEVKWEVNEEDNFSVEKSSDGSMLTFHSRLPGVYARQGAVRLVPELAEGEVLDGDGEVLINLDCPRMGTYKLLLGEWHIDKISSDVIKSITLEEKVYGESYNMYLNGLENSDQIPLEAVFEAASPAYPLGRVLLRTSQELGVVDSHYYSLHYNGLINNVGVYIFSGDNNNIAWAAEPVLDDATQSVSLSFYDSGLGAGYVATTFCLWRCVSSYYNFNTSGSEAIVWIEGDGNMQISKSYPDTDPDAGEDGTGETDN